MKISLLNFLFLITIIHASAQHKTDTNLVRKYYAHINSAELNIIDTNYDMALLEYQTAFNLKYPNGKDLYNAFVASYYLKDTANAYRYYNWLAYHGMKRGYFSDSTSNPDFYKFVTASHDSSGAAGYAKLDVGAVEFWDIVDEFTRKYRTYTPEYFMNKEVFKEKAKEMDALNRENIIGFIESGGKYGFEEIGFWTKNSGPHVGNSPFYNHIYHTKSYDNNLLDTYKELCLKGKLDLMDFISIHARSFKATVFAKNYGLRLYNQDLDKEDTRDIDRLRKKMYLSPLSDYYKRKKFDNWHKMSSGIWERNMFIFFCGSR